MNFCFLDSPVGRLQLVASDAGLRAILWPEDEASGRISLPGAEENPSHPVLQKATQQLNEYFAGTRRDFDVPLDLQGTPFQLKTWAALCEIPFAQTRTYAEQARLIGNPKAVRAVGGANGRNPISIIVPCHRIIGSDGKLTGFAGSIEMKKWLLDFERKVHASL
jgi:methylated-DNA-[protein]-cysteine S-methyltransferase